MATPVGNSVALTGNPDIDALVQGGSWQLPPDRTITYSLDLEFDGTVALWNPVWEDAVSRAFAAWAAVANINIVRVGTPNQTYQNLSNADISISLSPGLGQGVLAALGVFPDPVFADQLLAFAGYSRNSGEFPFPRPEGDISFDSSYQAFANLQLGSAGYEIILHEIGHSLGLKHPEDDGGNGRPTRTTSGIESVMTNSAGIDNLTASTPMPLDIQAIQRIYGANMDYHTGDDTYLIQNDGLVNTIWDAGGNDTLDASGQIYGSIDLREGHSFTHGTIVQTRTSIAYGVTIENAIGGYDSDTIIGNDVANHLYGGAGYGNDTLDGGLGADTMVGGTGNDLYRVDNSGDVLMESPAEGTDLVESTAPAYTLSANVENLNLAGSTNIDGTGNDGSNIIKGNAGANRLDGGMGVDRLEGGGGDDVYIIRPGDLAPSTYLSLSNSFGNTFYYGAGDGNFDIVALGDSTADGVPDRVFIRFLASAGGFWTFNFDVDQLGIPFQAGTYSNAERSGNASPGHPGLLVQDAGASFSVTGMFTVSQFSYSGSTLQSLVVSFEEQNTGPTYTLSGTLSINGPATTAADTIVELQGGGVDSVQSGVSYALPDQVENLTLTGASALIGTGNALPNLLIGNAGNNTLDGGAGNDTLDGGEGTDTARFPVASSQAAWNTVAGVTTVTSSLGTDRLTNIEFLQFSDQNIFIGVNSAPNGIVSISGNIAQGQVLTAGNTLTDADGLGAISYQWQSSNDGGATWTNLNTGAALTLAQSQVGKPVRALASYTDGNGTPESVASAATGNVANVNDAPVAGTSGPRFAGIGEPFSLNLGALFNDADGETLGFAASGLPGGLLINPATGVVSGITPGSTGLHHITVSATDPGNTSAILAFDLNLIVGNSFSAHVVTRGGSALPGVTAHELISPTPPGSLYGFRNIVIDDRVDTGIKTLTAELFATGGGGEQQCAFTLQAAGGAILQSFVLTGSINTAGGWSISETHPAGGYTLAATNAGGGIAAGSLIGKLTMTLPAAFAGGPLLDFSNASLGLQSAPGRSLSFDPSDMGSSGQLNATLPDSDSVLVLTRGTGDIPLSGATRPVTAGDALDALKLSVGLPSSRGNTWKELIAADMNHDGRVTAADALEILKASVGINTIQPSWVFVPNDTAFNPNLAGMTKSSVTYKDEISLGSITSATSATITGILVGDVNNSWVIPT